MERIDLLLKDWAEGDSRALDQIVETLYSRLMAMARGMLGAGCKDQTIEAGDLVHGAWSRLRVRRTHGFRDQDHFLAVAHTEMRHVMLNAAEKAGAIRRGGQADLFSLNRFLTDTGTDAT